MESQVIAPQYILSGTLANRPNGSFTGQYYYATDTKQSFQWDGIEWITTSVNLNEIIKLIGLNGLNILDLTAQSSLEIGVNANFERDIYITPTGYLSTINNSNTTATHLNNIYQNYFPNTRVLVSNSYSSDFTTNSSVGMWFISSLSNYKIKSFSIANSTRKFLKDENGNILATDNEIFDYSLSKNVKYRLEGDNQGSNFQAENRSNFSKNEVIVAFGGSRNGADNSINSLYQLYLEQETQNLIIETNIQNLDFSPSKFMIISHETINGTGSVTYDISFDSGSNYQTNLESFTEYEITNTGTQMILKQNLNAGASEGLAETSDYGVLIW